MCIILSDTARHVQAQRISAVNRIIIIEEEEYFAEEEEEDILQTLYKEVYLL